MTKDNFYIVFEGGDGSGKTTLSKKAVKYIPNSILSKEPTELPIGKKIRSNWGW